ncbi:MAG: cell division protein ZapA [Gammaproteobacteria bacterium]|jgi:cell division protein ZapA
MEANNHVSVNILDKPYQVKCPPENVQELQNAANYVDQKMREIRDGGVVGADRIAIITALNMAYSLLYAEQKENKEIDSMAARLADMQTRIEELLTQADQNELL